MSTPLGEQFPAGMPETSPLMEAMQTLDLSAQGYLAACIVYHRLPNGENESAVHGATDEHFEAVQGFLTSLAEDTDFEGYQSDAMRFLFSHDAMQATLLNQLVGYDLLQALNPETAIDVESAVPLTQDEFKRVLCASILGVYKWKSDEDTAAFIGAASGAAADRQLERHEKVKGLVLGAGKLALGGIASGVAIAWWARHRR